MQQKMYLLSRLEMQSVGGKKDGGPRHQCLHVNFETKKNQKTHTEKVLLNFNKMLSKDLLGSHGHTSNREKVIKIHEAGEEGTAHDGTSHREDKGFWGGDSHKTHTGDLPEAAHTGGTWTNREKGAKKKLRPLRQENKLGGGG